MSEYLSVKNYVSRTHAKVSVVDGEIYITNLSSTNFTYVNNEKIESNTPFLLKEGDEIGLGGRIQDGQRQQNAAYFIVRKT